MSLSRQLPPPETGSPVPPERPQKTGNFLLNLSAGQRLMLGFLTAALIASLTISVLWLHHATSLQEQSNVYQSFVESDTTLPLAIHILVLMDIKTHLTLDDALSGHSHETLLEDQSAMQGLIMDYNKLLTEYGQHHLIYQHPDEIAFLTEAGHVVQVIQQHTLFDSALRTWSVYRTSQKDVLLDIAEGHISDAQRLERLQGDFTHTDALSALSSLFQFNGHLAASMHEYARIQDHDQLLTTERGGFLAIVGIVLAGILISQTFVRRLDHLRTVTQSVQQGNLDGRLTVVGRDEIADVSASVNAILETMVNDAVMYEQQRQLNQFKDQFILNVSHELRTPLTQVYGFLELLIDFHGQLDEAQQASFLDKAKYGCQELMLLVNTVLDATRASSEVVPPNLKEVKVLSLVHEVLDFLDPRQRQAYVFTVNVAEEVVVLADAQYIRQVLRNLVSNAIKYSPQQTEITITADTNEQQDEAIPEARICVADRGPGIPPDELPQLFQKFVRLKRDVSGKVRGTGLGLYVCRQLIEAMHGRIWVESTGIEGEGSRFYFTLPLAVHTAMLVEELPVEELEELAEQTV